MKRSLAVIFFAAGVSSTYASSEYLDAFLSHYKATDNSAYVEKSCGLCHASDSDFSFNPYGADLRKALTDSKSGEVDGALLASLESLDSDGDGTPNGTEIANKTLPGDATSGLAAGAAPAKAEPSKEKKPKKFPPKNGYHPAIVHFPIALFIGGLILDFLGMIRKNKTMLSAGWYCIVLACISTLGAIASGALAMLLLKLPYRGLIFEHIVYAIGSSAMMWVMVALRVDRHEQMNVRIRAFYYLLALGCLLMISWAGHLGGLFVYGE